ncbi:MAG: hypothetical protein GY696_30850 [Gammaproteobacteria bacterium]|nr:hypothetical protein [Gammaproteobacteria bacterium]
MPIRWLRHPRFLASYLVDWLSLLLGFGPGGPSDFDNHIALQAMASQHMTHFWPIVGHKDLDLISSSSQ